MMMTSDEEWVKAAITDDSMVVELLVKLNQSASPPKTALAAVDWSVGQRRSKPVTLHQNKPAPSASPTTPLSWSCATSPSEGYEESSRPPPKRSDATRSKGTSETTIVKGSRKKKTLMELKEEEIKLLKDRKHLKRELTTLRFTFETQTATNESLKKMKLDSQTETQFDRVGMVTSNSDETQQKVSDSDSVPPRLPSQAAGYDLKGSLQALDQSCTNVQKKFEDGNTQFVLPDLNLPLDDNGC